MSVVTNILLSVSSSEERTSYPGPPKGLLKNWKGTYALVAELNKWLEENGHGPFGEEIDAGGEKGFEANVFAAAFNYFNTEKFIEHAKTLPWRNREAVQIFVKEQEDSKFTLYELVEPQ